MLGKGGGRKIDQGRSEQTLFSCLRKRQIWASGVGDSPFFTYLYKYPLGHDRLSPLDISVSIKVELSGVVICATNKIGV